MENTSVMETARSTFLPNKRVKVEPIPRKGWLPPGHDGEFMYTGTKFETCLPLDSKRKQLVQVLTKEEQTFFENELFLNPGDLSIYRKENNYWHNFRVSIDKEGAILDLTDPIDNLKWRILMVDPRVAPSWSERYYSGAYKFALVDEDVVTADKVAKANKRKDAYKFLGKIENSPEKMRNVLRLYGDNPGKKVKREVMYAKIDELIEDDVTLAKLIEVINDPHFELKIFLEDALICGAISKKGTRYSLPGGDKIGGTLLEAIDYLQDPLNQDVRLKIKNQIELSN